MSKKYFTCHKIKNLLLFCFVNFVTFKNNLLMAPKRKQKKQREDYEEEVFEDGADLDWRTTLPSLVDQLAEADETSRMGIIRSITDILTARPVERFIKPYVDDIILNLHEPIFNATSKEESIEALTCICSICLNMYQSFEPVAMAFINELIPTFDQVDQINEHPFRAFAIGYICLLTVRNTEYTTKVLDKLTSFFTNDKLFNRLEDELIADAILAINLLLPCFSTSTITDVFYDKIKAVLDKGFDSADGPTMLATLDLFALTHEYLTERQFVNDKGEEMDDPKPEAEEILNEYVNNYLKPVRQAANGIDNKDDQKLVRERSKLVQGLIDGEDFITKVNVNIQQAEILGAKKSIFLNSTKRVARFHFEQLLVVNRGVQYMLGVHFLDRAQAELLKLNMREEIDMGREEAEKNRYRDIVKKRKLKERALTMPEEAAFYKD